MFHVLLLLSGIALLWGCFLLFGGNESEKFAGSVVLVGIPFAWACWLSLGDSKS